MKCLSCGDCCLRMSPLAPEGEPCPKLASVGDVYFCSDYENRPEACINHQFPFSICPVGMDMLKYEFPFQASVRIDHCWDVIKEHKLAAFVGALEQAEATINTWPEWKRNVRLGRDETDGK